MMRNSKIIFSLLFIALFVVGCSSSFKADIPQGFAVSRKSGNLLIYSPDGFKLRIKTENNTPKKDTLFWSESLKTQLTNTGYFMLDETSFNSANLEWKRSFI